MFGPLGRFQCSRSRSGTCWQEPGTDFATSARPGTDLEWIAKTGLDFRDTVHPGIDLESAAKLRLQSARRVSPADRQQPDSTASVDWMRLCLRAHSADHLNLRAHLAD